MKIMPEGYTIQKLLLGWLFHFIFSLVGGFVVALIGLHWAHSVAYPTVAYGFREGEQFRRRRMKGKVEIWPKTILDVLFASLGGWVGMVLRGVI